MAYPDSRPETTVVSAPGKVLLAGGYLVLDRQYSGLVVSTSSRFYCVVRPIDQPDHTPTPTSSIDGVRGQSSSSMSDATGIAGPSVSQSSARIIVRAGQFPGECSTWSYEVTLVPSPPAGATTSSRGDESEDWRMELRQEDSGSGRNKFVEITLIKTLQVAWELIAITKDKKGHEGQVKESGEELLRRIRGDGGGLNVVMLADNDFYSQREQLSSLDLPRRISSLFSLPAFSPHPQAIHKTNKTGLGSSAALVTSLTAGILQHLDVISLLPLSPTPPTSTSSDPRGSSSSSSPSSSSQQLDLVHNLAQLAHCSAQGKVGSGFDISSAVFGTHQYTRFSPSILAPLLDSPAPASPPSSSASSPSLASLSLQARLVPSLSPGTWDHSTLPFRLPRGLRLMLADVDAGTDTPSFVGKVLKWREGNRSTADELWGNLGRANDTLGELIRDLSTREGEENYGEILQGAAREPIEKLDIGNPTSQLLVRIHASLVLIRSFLQHMSKLSNVPIEPDEQTRLLDRCCSLPGVIGGGVPGAGGYDAIFLLVIDDPKVISSVEDVWSTWTEMSVCPLGARQSDGGLQVETLKDVRGLSDALARL